MDLDEWELLPVNGFRNFSDDCEQKASSGQIRAADDTMAVFHVDLDYFRCPSPTSKLSPPSRLVPVRILLDPPVKKEPGEERGAAEGENTIAPSVQEAADQDAVYQVSFKKMKENEFVDMKILESPRSGSRPISPPIENFRFEDRPESPENARSPRRVTERNGAVDVGIMGGEEVNRGGLNIWKWSLTGIGAICSFGVAAATVCTILVIGSHQNSKQNHQKIRFRIYSDDKVSGFLSSLLRHLPEK